MLRNFRSYQIAVEFYARSKQLSLNRVLKDQLERASSSVALNLAEGSGRGTCADQKRFYEIALGSLRECQAILDLVQAPRELVRVADKLAASIYCLIRSRG
jgi:four helix bundle protein